MKTPTLALAMIVKNEAENLPKLFESFQGCFDEVHLTDTGSTDNTVEVAKALGAQVHHFEWCDDFAKARNSSFEPIKTDYVMWLDGDDVLENKENFIQWKQTVMGTADYHVATYHYTTDPVTGKSVCSFARERVFRRDRQFKWQYFLHEGILPKSSVAPVRISYAPTWSVRHQRTEKDLAQDKSRNLRIFNKHINGLDARMRYYYGKELFETGKPVEAIHELMRAASDPILEPHDRTLALQYSAFSYMACNQFERVVDVCHSGLQLNPQRGEFYASLGDAYLKMNRFSDALPAFHAAKNCQFQSTQQGYAGVIFTSEDAYTTYPRNQIARIYANLGQFDRAKMELKECIELFNSTESKELLVDVEKHHRQVKSFENAKDCEDIVITGTPFSAYEWDGELYRQKAMGGSETAAIEMAEWLHKLSGRRVKVFNVRTADKTVNGVEYISTARINDYMAENKPYLHIAWRHNIQLTNAPTFVWCHDLVAPAPEQDHYVKLLCLTPFHKRYIQGIQGVPEEKIWVTRNGIRPDRFEDGPWEKDPFQFVFSSSPDRGLDRAMLVLDKVREKYPQVKLSVHYGVEHLDQYGLKDLRIKLTQMMEERKDWVTYRGATPQDELTRMFKKSAYCVQPSDFIETSMISAMELICSGVYPIMRSIGGVVDTLALAEKEGMATLVDSDCVTPDQYDLYAKAVLEAIESEAYKRVSVDPKSFSWEEVAKSWLKTLPVLAGRVKAEDNQDT